jgi:dTDP-4-dehydrorhamnose 3,5-epimerase-like enzyme
MNVQITELPKFEDERGFLVEFLKGTDLQSDHKAFAQIYLTTIGPGYMRGNHYHEKFYEYFTVMHGRIQLVLEDVRTKERKELILDAADKPLRRVCFGPYTAHVLHNISDTVAVVVSYATEMYNKEDVDQIPYMVLKKR